MENVSTLTLNMESSQIARLTLHTPALPLTKLMTPPNLRVSKLVRSLEDLYKLYQERRNEFIVLEDSYIASRNLSKEYSEEEAEKILSLAREVLKYRTLH